MSIELLQQELAALPARDRRRIQAFLVALENSSKAGHRKKLADKIDQPSAKFAKVKLKKVGGYTVGVPEQPIDMEAVKAALAEFP